MQAYGLTRSSTKQQTKNNKNNIKALYVFTAILLNACHGYAWAQENVEISPNPNMANNSTQVSMPDAQMNSELQNNLQNNIQTQSKNIIKPIDVDVEITVTAQKLPIAVKDTTQSATVYPLNSLSNNYEILRDIPSLGATSTGTYGGQTSLFIRGGESSHNLTLLNGVPINQLSSGIATVERLPFKQFKQLELVRGNVSAIYGSAAMSGVLNLTQKNSTKPVTFEAISGLGSYGARELGLKAGQYQPTDDGYFAYDFQLNHEKRHTQSSRDASENISINPDRDGMQQNSVGANFYYKKNRYQAQMHHLLSDDKISYDQEAYNNIWMLDPIGQNITHDSKGRLRYHHLIQQLQITPELLVKMDNALVQDNSREYKKNPSIPSTNDSPTDVFKQRTLFNALELRYQPTLQHTFVAQAESNLQKIDATNKNFNNQYISKYSLNQRNTQSVRLAYLYQDEKNRLDANLRRDWIGEGEKSLQANSYYIAGAHYVLPSLQIGLNHAKAFKAPTFNDLYGGWGANPDLRAEKSKSYEAFMRYGLGPVVFKTSFYQNKYKDLIGYDANYARKNIKRATAQGIEQSMQLTYGNWQAGLFANYQHVRDETEKAPILRRPDWLARLNLSYQNNISGMPLEVGGDVYYRSGSKDYVGYSIGRLHAYTNVGLFAEVKPSKNWVARLSANNIFNKKAQEVYGYPIAARSMMFNLKYQY